MTDSFVQSIEVRWSDLDPNYHVRHSVYYDYGAYCRICFLSLHGITSAFFTENHFGPILFREECTFRREIKMGDRLTIDLQLMRARPDFSRWSIEHKLTRNGQHAATLITDGAWIDTESRKLTIPHEFARSGFAKMPRSESFEWIK